MRIEMEVSNRYEQVEPVLLVRYGEVFLKKGNRRRFVDRLIQNISMVVRKYGLRVRALHARLEISRAESNRLTEAVAAVTHVFGVNSVSPASRLPLDYDLLRSWLPHFVEAELQDNPASTFRVDAKRAFKQFPINSMDLNRGLGSLISSRFPLRVNLTDPDLTIGIEIHPRGIYVYTATYPGPRGLPVGSSGRVMLLLSGGIDSPVAGWMMASRGCALTGVHFHSQPYTSPRSVEKCIQLAKILCRWHGPMKLYLVPVAPIQEKLRKMGPESLQVILLRRSMARLANMLADKVSARALATGESLGQVASQTIDNLAVIEETSSLPILRPLLGMDKEAIINLAKRAGTYEVSIQPFEDCCSLFVPKHPEIAAKLEEVKQAEEKLQLVYLERTALENTQIASIM